MRRFYQPVDLRSRQEMTQYLTTHFRYPTLNSWNRSTLYACFLKITHLGLSPEVVDKLFDMNDYVANQAAFRVTTGMLNTVLADAQTRVQPPTDKGRRLKIYYMTQVGVKPPHFVVFCNDRRLFHFSYQRYLENCIRSSFRLEGTPIILSILEKGDKEE